MRFVRSLLPLSFGLLLVTAVASGQEEEPVELPETEIVGVAPGPDIEPAFDPVIGAGAVFGDVDAVFNTPGSGAYLDSSYITTQSYANVDQVLRQVPGVYLRGEDGFGNFPNISLRGVDTTRSAKVTIMEDGVLTAPAPYSAPSAYYFPNVGRMSAVEVIKGHSQIAYGPHTTGGAINFLSTTIPEEPSAFLRAMYGSFNEFRVHTWAGTTSETAHGRIGFLVEGYLRENDGFKAIDLPSGLAGGGPFSQIGNTQTTGFTRGETMLKVFWEPCTQVYSRWEAKAGYSDFDAEESYLGLSETDIVVDPLRRYAASRFDNFSSDHTRAFVRYIIGDAEVDMLSLANTAYYNKFHRNWYKLHELRAINGVGLPSSQRSLSRNLEDGSAGLSVLRGELPGVIRLRANNRDYYSYGYETVANAEFDAGPAQHKVKAGVRYHADQIHPFQNNDDYTMDANGFVDSVNFGTPGSQRNRIQETHAVAFFAQDAISIGALTVSPGIRLEHLNMSTIDFNGSNAVLKDDLGLVGGGVGVTYDLGEQIKLLAGFHRGFSPPNPRGRILNNLKEEESLASEAGLRYLNAERALGAQLIAFYTHFNDLLVIDNIGGTGSGDTENVGQVYSGGLEFSVQYDPGVDRCWGFSNPWRLSGTYTDARLLNDVNSPDAESIFAGGRAGNRLPYIPELAVTVSTGLHFDLFGFDLTGVYVDETYTTASNSQGPFDSNGVYDARYGKTDDFFVFDLAGYILLGGNWKVFGGVQNLSDRTYVASRHPHGPRPNAPLFGYMGVETTY